MMKTGCSDFGDESFLLLFTDAPLPARLWREIRQAAFSFRNNPAGFIQALLSGDGLTRQRFDLLQAGAALAVAAYSLVFVLLTLLGLHRPVLTETAVSTTPLRLPCEDCEITSLASAPVKPASGREQTAGAAAGGSSPVRRESHGGGGSGQQQLRPAQAGVLPPMVNHPPSVLASINQPNFVPTLPVTPTIEGDPEALLKFKGPTGDPTGERDTKSNGPGRGGAMGDGDGPGIGNGKGGGALKGEDDNVGRKRNQPGCCGQGGTGSSGQAYTTRPVITYKEKAQYTEEARKNGVMGVVVLSAVFGEDGEIYDIRPVRQLPDGLTEEAIRALRKIRFRPATKNGTPVSVRMNIEFSFTIF